MTNSIEHFSQHFHWIFSSLDKDSIMEWTGITWAIWRAPNQIIFHKNQRRPDFIRDQGLDLLKAFQCASAGQSGL